MIDELNEACNHFRVLAGQPLVSGGRGRGGAGATSLVNWFSQEAMLILDEIKNIKGKYACNLWYLWLLFGSLFYILLYIFSIYSSMDEIS